MAQVDAVTEGNTTSTWDSQESFGARISTPIPREPSTGTTTYHIVPVEWLPHDRIAPPTIRSVLIRLPSSTSSSSDQKEATTSSVVAGHSPPAAETIASMSMTFAVKKVSSGAASWLKAMKVSPTSPLQPFGTSRQSSSVHSSKVGAVGGAVGPDEHEAITNATTMKPMDLIIMGRGYRGTI